MGTAHRSNAPATGPAASPSVVGVSRLWQHPGSFCIGGSAMRSRPQSRTMDRRNFLGSLTLAGAAAVAPGTAIARESAPGAPIRLAQAAPAAAAAATAPVVKTAERVAGSTVN